MSADRPLSTDQAAHVACCGRRLDGGANPEITLSILRQVSGKAAMLVLIAERPYLREIAERKNWL